MYNLFRMYIDIYLWSSLYIKNNKCNCEDCNKCKEKTLYSCSLYTLVCEKCV